MSDPTTFRRVFGIAVGPAAFVATGLIRLDGLDPGAHLALACYVWVLAWWVAAPVPWAVTGFLPLVLFPLLDILPFRETSALYGQRILPFVLGVMLFGHAFQKHGLGRRLAVRVLGVPGVAASGNRLVLMFLVVTAAISAIVDDAAAVAIMIPIAVSVARFASINDATGTGTFDKGSPRLLSATCLAVLYGSAAGGIATPAGVPFNPLAISLLEQLTAYRVSFVEWTLTGLILTAAVIPVYFFVLIGLSPPGRTSTMRSADWVEEERRKLGPMTRGEKNVVFVMVVMIALWFLPAFVPIDVLDVWLVPSVAMVLLFLLPVDVRRGEMTLNAGDLEHGVLWNVLFLVVGGTALASGLADLGVTGWLGSRITATVSASALPWLAGAITPVLSHLTSGTATTSMVCTVLYPIATDLGYNSAVLARIIAGTALAVSVPWAGAASGTAFGSGAIRFPTMIRAGVVATILTMIVVTFLSMVLVPALGAYSGG